MIRFSRAAALVAVSVLALNACASPGLRTSSPSAPAANAVPPAPPSAVVDRRPKGAWAQTYSDIAADPAVRFGVLPNGMRYALMRNATPTGQASLRLRFDAGSLMERDEQQGLAHFLEHMAFNGSKKVPEGEMVKILERHGLAFGADTNASTGFTETVYQLDLPRTDDDTVDTSLMLMREAASELTIDQEAVNRERGVVLSEERARDTPQVRSFLSQLNFTLPGHIATRRLPIGKVEVLQKAPAALIRQYYEAYYRPERAVLVMVGDFDVAAMEAKISRAFGDWKGAGEAGAEYPRTAPPARTGPEAKVYVEAGVPLALQMSWVAPPDLDPDTKAERREDLIDMIGFAIFNRRLERLSRSGEPPFISAGAFRSDQFKSAEATALSVTLQPGRWREGLSAVEQEQRRLVQFGVRPDEIEREVTQLRADLKQAVASMATRRTPRLANEIVSTLEDGIVQTNPAQDLALFEEQAKDITPETVSAAMKQAFAGSGPLIFVSSPTTLDGGEAAVLSAYQASRAKPVTAGQAETVKTWPYETFGPLGKVVEQTEIDDLDTVFVRFANGVRLTVKPTKFRDDEILVSTRLGDGRLGLPAERMSAAWASSALTEGGLDQLTAEEIDSILRSKIVSAGFGIDDDAFTLGGRTRPEDLELQLQLLAAYAVHPGWRPEAFQRLKTFYSTVHDQQDATASGVFGREASRLLHNGDARWAFPSPEEIAAGKPEDLQNVLRTPLGAGPVEIVIVGDITVEKAIEAVAQTFGALPQRPGADFKSGTAKVTRFPAPSAQPVTLTHKGRADQAIAFMAWPTDDFFGDMQEARTLRVLADIFDLRLTDEVREKQGATYSPQVGAFASSVFQDYGYLSTSIETQPDKLAGFFNDVNKIAADLRDHPVTEDELDRAKKPALESLEKRKQSNEFWLGQLSGAQADRRKIDAIRTSSSAIQRVTAADVQAAARKYLREDKTWRLQVLPQSK